MYFIKATVRITQPGRSLFLPFGFSSFSLRQFQFFISVILVLLLGGHGTGHAQGITLKTDQPVSEAGYYQLSWELPTAPDGTVFIVDERTSEMALGKPVYSGKDTAMVISGKPDGTYIYQVRSADNSYLSNTLEVKVAHHSLSTAFRFFVLGAIVFIVLLIAILRGNRLVKNA